MARLKKAKKELTGWHVLAILLAFFGLMLAVNVYFAVVAVSSFRGEDVPRSYRQGLEYNQTISARDAQAKLGWTARTNTVVQQDGQIKLIVLVQDAEGLGVEGLSFEGVLRHPTDTANDIILDINDTGAGRYVANVTPAPGQWSLVTEAARGPDRFKVRQDIWVK